VYVNTLVFACKGKFGTQNEICFEVIDGSEGIDPFTLDVGTT